MSMEKNKINTSDSEASMFVNIPIIQSTTISVICIETNIDYFRDAHLTTSLTV